MNVKTIIRIAAVAAFLSGGLALSHSTAALAQAQAQPAPKATTMDKKAPAADKKAMGADEKRAKSKECSDEATKKGLHGKARKAFRSKCKRGES